jgi:riboflavin synthase
MFTGIVQELGKIVARSSAGDALRFTVSAPRISSRLRIGDSVSCDGACLTVETLVPEGFTVCAIPETLAKTTVGLWTEGTLVNLETALTADTPLGGHFVLGHVDGVCGVESIRDLGDGGRELTVRLPEEFVDYCVYKGSITLSGVSLTIASVEDDRVRVALIPHTLEMTTLGFAVPRARMNFEVDILAKHVERQLRARETSRRAKAEA